MSDESLGGGIRDNGRWSRADALLIASLFAATLLSRLPFRTSMLYAWDSVLYAFALHDFDVRLHHPQPPGHLYYVGLIRLVNKFVPDDNAAIVWISVISSAAAVAAFYMLGRLMFRRPVSILAAALLATSVSFWAYGEVAYPYTLLCLLSVTTAAFSYLAWHRGGLWVPAAAAALGVASGFRQDLLFFMLPLLAVSVYRHGRFRVVAAAGILAALTAAWYIPSALSSGGFSAYRQASSAQSEYLMTYFSVFGRGIQGVAMNVRELVRFLFYGLMAAIPIGAVCLAALPTRRMRPLLRDGRLLFLLLWILPSLLFYVFMHVGEYGYVFTLIPGMMLLASWGLCRLCIGRARVFAVTAIVAVSANAVLFLGGLTPLSASRIEARDQILKDRTDAIRQNFDPKSTLIVSVFDYQQVRYYLPEYLSWNFDPALDKNPTAAIPPGARRVIIFEEYLFPAEGIKAEERSLSEEQRLFVIPVNEAGRVAVDWTRRRVGLE